MVRESGLKINTLHDIGGEVYKDGDSLITPDTYEYLEYGIDDIPCVVFHTPHIKTDNKGWWNKYSSKAGTDLTSLKDKIVVCIENMPYFDCYQVPLINPNDMLDFAEQNGIYVNIDTTHYATVGIDIIHAAKVLRERVKSIHLSDFKDGKNHLYLGEGELKLKEFLTYFTLDNLHALTIECNIPYDQSNPNVAVLSMKKAQNYLQSIIK